MEKNEWWRTEVVQVTAPGRGQQVLLPYPLKPPTGLSKGETHLNKTVQDSTQPECLCITECRHAPTPLFPVLHCNPSHAPPASLSILRFLSSLHPVRTSS